MSQGVAQVRKGIPPAAAMVLILLALAAGGWFLYVKVFKSAENPTADVVILDGMGRGRYMNQRGAMSGVVGEYPEGVSKARGMIVARRAQAFVRCMPDGKGNYPVTFDYLPSVRRTWVRPEQWDLHILGIRVAGTPALAQHMKVTPQQQEKLRALAYIPPITPADRNKLSALVKAWDSATGNAKDSAAKSLVELVGQLGSAHLASTKAAMVTRVQQIPQILSADQIKLANNWASSPAPAPSTAPAAPSK